ncbi:MAG: NAD(P)-binding domain-containing protein [Methanobacterium paludis]|nr:NAD(P)-binding domain-containing protein [Methanobacterium paludis]
MPWPVGNKRIINSINQNRINNVYHPLIKLNDNIKAFQMSETKKIDDSDLVIFCVPSGSTRTVAKGLSDSLNDKILISTAKGIEYPSLKYMTQIIEEETNNNTIFSLSGPTFADELIRNVLSGITLGINKNSHKKQVMQLFQSPCIILDCSGDVEGVELCSILKNIYATAMGIFDTYFQGHNEHNALLNLCFKEMNYILTGSGHYGLSDHFCAFGDLNLTANTDKSRNRTLGLMLGKNIKLDPSSTVTLESMRSVKAIKDRSNKIGLKTPMVNFVKSTFDEDNDIRNSINQLIIEMSNFA